MQLKTIIFLFALAISACGTTAQNQSTQKSPEEAGIRLTIQTYFDGWLIGDTTKLGKAMHTTCKLKNIKDEKVLVFDRAKYLSFFTLKEEKRKADCRIIKIDVTANIASAKCEIETPDRLYTDYFNLMKLEDTWYIVDKIATNWAKKDE